MGQIADETLRKIQVVRQGFVTTFCNPENRVGQLYPLLFIGGTLMTVVSTLYLYGYPKFHQAMIQALEVKALRN